MNLFGYALSPVLQAILEDHALPLDGDHGVAHWARVVKDVLKQAEETGATYNLRTVEIQVGESLAHT